MNKPFQHGFVGSALLAGLLSLAPMASADDTYYPPSDNYSVMDGLDGRENACVARYPNGTNSGQVLVSRIKPGTVQSVGSDWIYGAIQATFDDGRSSVCQRFQQEYSMVDRLHQAIPAMTNTFIGMRIPSLCSKGPTCAWSTIYAGPTVPEGSSLADYSESQRNAVGVRFPESIGQPMSGAGSGYDPENGVIMTKQKIAIPASDYGYGDGLYDYINVEQRVYRPQNAPTFGITWKIWSTYRTYKDVKFWHAVDTYTAGNDFGFGYLCNISKVAGGTGGAAFFQGTVALHPSQRQFEGWWADVFNRVRNDKMPDYEWSTPLSAAALNSVPLTALEDNGIAQEWNGIEVRPGPTLNTLSTDKTYTYISEIWTFDDPILQSSYGSARSLFALGTDDVGWTDGSGTLHAVKPQLFDVIYNPHSWRGKIKTDMIPMACNGGKDCEVNGVTEQCIPSRDCAGVTASPGESSCPTYCGLGTCDDSNACPSGQSCVLGICKVGPKWETKAMNGTESGRRVFTFTPTGERYWFDVSSASILNTQFNLPSTEDAQDLIRWTLGTLNEASEPSKIIPSNESMDYDLLNPTKTDISGKTIKLLRERYDNSVSDRWLLGDIAHADPVYIGMHPTNSWSDKPSGPTYNSYYNSKDYQNRQPILLVSANDGMLHAYDAASGEELWAFIPWDVLPKLVDLSKPYYEQLRTPTMDLKPVVQDAYDASTSSPRWRTVLMVGSRGGGDRYWAMDITPPYGHLAPSDTSGSGSSGQERLKFLWSFSDPDLGLTYSIPTGGRFRSGDIVANGTTPERWLVFVGSGYAKHAAAQMQKEGYFYILDLFNTDSTGYGPKLLSKLHIGQDGGDKIDGLFDSEVRLTNNVLSSATVADYDDDGYQDDVYIGDMVGHLLRFSVEPSLLNACSSASACGIRGQVVFNTWRSTPSASLLDYRMTVFNKRLGNSESAAQRYQFYKYPRPITVRPIIWRTTDSQTSTGSTTTATTFMGSSDNANRIMVYFGTGKYDAFYDSFDEYKRDPTSGACQSWPYGSSCTRDLQGLFAVIDRRKTGAQGVVPWSQLMPNDVSDTTISGKKGTTVVRTINQGGECKNAGSDWHGWYITLDSTLQDNRGEKVITEPVIWQQQNLYRSQTETQQTDWIVFFTTFTPNMQGTCDIRTVNGSGGGFLMTVTAECGGDPGFAIQDVSGDQLLGGADAVNGHGYSGQKLTGSILSRVDVDPYQKSVYVKTGTDSPVMRIQIAGLPSLQDASTSFYRLK